MEHTDIIKKAILFSNENYKNNAICVETIAAYAGFSMDYFNKLFLSHTGFNVMAYINYIRVKEAKRLLKMSDKTILDIALEVGYDSHEGLIKAFKKVYGTTPTEYRKQTIHQAPCWGDMVDVSCIHQFLHQNPDFTLLDSDDVIDGLLEKNARKYGYICTTIKPMGLWLIAPNKNFTKGFLTVCDNRHGGIWMEAVTDDMELLAQWLSRFEELTAFTTDIPPERVYHTLKTHGMNMPIEAIPHSVYTGNQKTTKLPQNITVRQLTAEDTDFIFQWANGKRDGYIQHLLTKQHYSDPSVLEYGVFCNTQMIAAVGCGMEECHSFVLNNCAKIRFAKEHEKQSLYQPIFEFVVNDIVEKGALPFDDIQHGEYAKQHGGFTANDVGFTTVCWKYQLHQ